MKRTNIKFFVIFLLFCVSALNGMDFSSFSSSSSGILWKFSSPDKHPAGLLLAPASFVTVDYLIFPYSLTAFKAGFRYMNKNNSVPYAAGAQFRYSGTTLNSVLIDGSSSGSTYYYHYFIDGGFNFSIKRKVYIGILATFFHRYIDGEKYSRGFLSFQTIYTFKNLFIYLYYYNLGSKYEESGIKETPGAGISYNFTLLNSAGFEIMPGIKVDKYNFYTGISIIYRNLIYLNGGWNKNNLSFGGGISVMKDIIIHYSYELKGYGSISTFSFTKIFNKRRKK